MVGNICRQLLRISCRACSLSIKNFPFCGDVARLPCARLRVKIFKAVNAAPTVFSVLERLPIACGSRSFLCSTFFKFSQVFGVPNALFYVCIFVHFSLFALCSQHLPAALPVVSKCALAGSFFMFALSCTFRIFSVFVRGSSCAASPG